MRFWLCEKVVVRDGGCHVRGLVYRDSTRGFTEKKILGEKDVFENKGGRYRL